jgi:hypothetical protein
MNQSGIRGHGVSRNSIPRKDLVKVQPIDATERVQPVNRRERALVLDIGETADQDGKFLIVMPFRDQLARLLNIPELQVQAFPDPPEALTGIVRAMILSLDKACGRVWHVRALSSRIITSGLFVVQQLWRPFVLKMEQ